MAFDFLKLKALVKAKGWEQRDLAKASGITDANISRYFKGIHAPKGKRLVKLAQTLGVSPDTLFNDQPGPSSKEEAITLSAKSEAFIKEVVENSVLTKKQVIDMLTLYIANQDKRVLKEIFGISYSSLDERVGEGLKKGASKRSA